MAGRRIVIESHMPALDLNGNPVSGARLAFYENGTTDLASVYTSAALTTAHPNPVIAGSDGVFPSIFADSDEVFSIAIADSSGAPIGGLRNLDNVRPNTVAYSIPGQVEVATLADAQALFPDDTATYIRTAGYAAAGDLGGALYASAASEPSHGGKFQTADGAWWELAEASVRPEMFGLFTNATVTTATLKKALDYAFATGKQIICGGSHTINGPISTEEVTVGVLRIQIERQWNITVDPGATAFDNVIGFMTDEVSSYFISGARLTINGNGKAGCGVYLRHLDTAHGGVVMLDAPIEAFDFCGSNTTPNSGGIFVWGRFERVVMKSPEVRDVTRTNPTGFCQGITTSFIAGAVEIYSPVVKRISSGAGTIDADGIKCFGLQAGTDPNRRLGSVRIYNAHFEDCQGRSYKDQCGDTILYGPRVVRDAAVMVANSNSIEFDFQFGGGLVLDDIIEYRKNGSTSPLHADNTHSVVAFQQLVNDAEMAGAIRNTTIISDVSIPRFALHATGASAKSSVTEVDGLTLIPRNGFSGSMLQRAVLEFRGDQVAASSSETGLHVRNVSGPLTCAVIGYAQYTSGDLTGKLSWSVKNCSTSLTITGNSTRAFTALANNPITAFKSFEIGDNPGYRSWFNGWTIDLAKIRAGTRFTVYLDDSTLTNKPGSLPGSGSLLIEGKGVDFAATTAGDTVVEITLNGGTASPSRWFSNDGGANWGALN